MTDKKRIANTIWVLLGVICLGMAVVGVFLPVLPTTPFLLLAAFFFSKGSKRIHTWLTERSWASSYIRGYREGRGILLWQKIFTIAFLWVTIGGTIFFTQIPEWVKLILGAIAIGVTVHMIRVKTWRPNLSVNHEKEITKNP